MECAVLKMSSSRGLRLLEVLELGLEPLGVGVELVGGLLQFGHAVINLVDLLQVRLQAFVWARNEKLDVKMNKKGSDSNLTFLVELG
jgi:hypothetical protein